MNVNEREVAIKLLEFMSYLASSARGALSEPLAYGSFRLIDAIPRFIALINYISTPLTEDLKQFMREILEVVERDKYKVMVDVDSYKNMLDTVVLHLARKLKNLMGA
ncbi:MAG: DUF6092 family protein [Candidatus Nezhaarchaeota archaeon]|nr:DUF6092 family protein [Candidatus Nezhaarchaeota archaeon]MCX8141170.1 DUF6092 family protein [Candidatus Nezhaarchaeota archaeon]MDW8050827.1 DUF6092 family protein [Nitrososphaerota archaeon]